MPATIFLQILRMSATASLVILAVLPVRLLLRKAPRVFSYVLWAVVLFRLLSPVAPEAPLTLASGSGGMDIAGEYTLDEASISLAGASEAAYRALGDALNGGLGVQHVRTTAQTPEGNAAYVTAAWWEVWVLFGGYVWLAGILVMLTVQLVRWLRLRAALRTVRLLEPGVWVSDRISSPFVMGILRPRVYLPLGLSAEELPLVLAHERYHIRRLDYAAKMLFFLALCIHWFNPLVWLAFSLFGKDMEMSCDEAVIRHLSPSVRADYAQALLRFSSGRSHVFPAPLAFGEGDVKGRILHIALWRSPRRGLRVLAGLVCALMLLGCGFDYRTEAEQPAGQYRMEVYTDEIVPPSLTLDPENGRFSFSYDFLSSYYIAGTYEIEGDTLTAVTDRGTRSFTFEILGPGTLRYTGTALMTIRNEPAVMEGATFCQTDEVWTLPMSSDADPEADSTVPTGHHGHDGSCSGGDCADPLPQNYRG